MNKLIAGIALFSFPIFTYAETTFNSEILVGHTQQNIQTSVQSSGTDSSFSSSPSSESYGFRVGAKFTENISIELSKHFHGSVDNKFTISYPSQSPGIPGQPPVVAPPSEDIILQAKIPVEIDSTRIGIKVETELFTNISVNARLGIAYWEYDEHTPRQDTFFENGESGNDVYYSLGTEYRFTENFYLGLEYSFFEVSEKESSDVGVTSSYSHEVEDLSLILGWVF